MNNQSTPGNRLFGTALPLLLVLGGIAFAVGADAPPASFSLNVQ